MLGLHLTTRELTSARYGTLIANHQLTQDGHRLIEQAVRLIQTIEAQSRDHAVAQLLDGTPSKGAA